KEALEQAELLPIELSEAADPELALQRGAAGAAVEAGDRELAGADGAGGDDVVDHGQRLRSLRGVRRMLGSWKTRRPGWPVSGRRSFGRRLRLMYAETRR